MLSPRLAVQAPFRPAGSNHGLDRGARRGGKDPGFEVGANGPCDVPQPTSPAGNRRRGRAEPRPYVSFAPWQTLDAVRTWKGYPEMREHWRIIRKIILGGTK